MNERLIESRVMLSLVPLLSPLSPSTWMPIQIPAVKLEQTPTLPPRAGLNTGGG